MGQSTYIVNKNSRLKILNIAKYFFGFALAFLCLSASAQQAGVTEFTHGEVTATRGSEPARSLIKGSEIFTKDNIVTGEKSRAQLRFTDGGLVSLMPSTNFSVEQYQLGAAKDGSDGSLVFSLLSGGLRTVTGAIGKKDHDDYALKTPVGTLGIRGTEFTAILGSNSTLLVHVGRGKVVLSNEFGSLEVNQGQNAVMSLGKAPEIGTGINPVMSDALSDGKNLPSPFPELDLPLPDLLPGIEIPSPTPPPPPPPPPCTGPNC